jgi:hypothetical protein
LNDFFFEFVAEFQQRLSVPPAGLGEQLKDANEEAEAEPSEQ